MKRKVTRKKTNLYSRKKVKCHNDDIQILEPELLTQNDEMVIFDEFENLTFESFCKDKDELKACQLVLEEKTKIIENIKVDQCDENYFQHQIENIELDKRKMEDLLLKQKIMLVDRQKEIEQKNDQIKGKDEELTCNNKNVEKELQSCKLELKKKDELITELENEKEDLKRITISEVQKFDENYQSQIDNLELDKGKKEAQIIRHEIMLEDLRKEMKEKVETIKLKQTKNEEELLVYKLDSENKEHKIKQLENQKEDFKRITLAEIDKIRKCLEAKDEIIKLKDLEIIDLNNKTVQFESKLNERDSKSTQIHEEMKIENDSLEEKCKALEKQLVEHVDDIFHDDKNMMRQLKEDNLKLINELKQSLELQKLKEASVIGDNRMLQEAKNEISKMRHLEKNLREKMSDRTSDNSKLKQELLMQKNKFEKTERDKIYFEKKWTERLKDKKPTIFENAPVDVALDETGETLWKDIKTETLDNLALKHAVTV